MNQNGRSKGRPFSFLISREKSYYEYMKGKSLCLCVVGLSAALSSCVVAFPLPQRNSPHLVKQVPGSRLIHRALSVYVPRGGASRFWGVTNLTFRGRQVWVHIYDVQKMDFSKGRASYGVKDYAPAERAFQAALMPVSEDPNAVATLFKYGVQRSRLDLMVVRRGEKPRRISSTSFFHVTWGNIETGRAVLRVGVENLWLDPAKKIPLLKVDLRQSGFRGDCGTNVLFVYSNGLRRGAVREGFGFGSDNSTAARDWSSSFGKVDANGHLQVVSLFSNRGGQTTTFYGWSKNYFRPLATRVVSNKNV